MCFSSAIVDFWNPRVIWLVSSAIVHRIVYVYMSCLLLEHKSIQVFQLHKAYTQFFFIDISTVFETPRAIDQSKWKWKGQQISLQLKPIVHTIVNIIFFLYPTSNAKTSENNVHNRRSQWNELNSILCMRSQTRHNKYLIMRFVYWMKQQIILTAIMIISITLSLTHFPRQGEIWVSSCVRMEYSFPRPHYFGLKGIRCRSMHLANSPTILHKSFGWFLFMCFYGYLVDSCKHSNTYMRRQTHVGIWNEVHIYAFSFFCAYCTTSTIDARLY